MKYILLTFTLAVFPVLMQAQNVSIVPKPSSIQVQSGNGFAITNRVGVAASGFPSETPLTSYVVQQIQAQTGIRIGQTANRSTELIELMLNTAKINLGQEGYTLKSSETGVQIEAATESGLFYGIQSLLQLLPSTPGGERPVVPAVQIFDRPRFAYRGMHLDVGRHFMPVSFIKKYIDLIALHKMNTFHWHLTEDQGWRIEIKKYPKLTEVASWRDETVIGHAAGSEVYDGKRYGGFYTQEQIKEVVAYAQSRYVTIIPEIEMPGHSQAAIAAYPELGCTGKKIKPMTTWGVSKDVFCPSEVTFSFLEDVLTEVMALFPSKYIHIGGDEVPKDHWKAHAGAQALIQKEGLKDEHELQSYFIRRIERFLNAKGRSLIGWDEILEGGLSPNATVMSWRGVEGGIAAAKEGHDAIMTPGSHCYFDHYQGDKVAEELMIGGMTTLEKVYGYEPIPSDLTPEEAKHILGAQGNVWTEYLKTPERVEYAALPRMSALAEVLWTPVNQRNWSDFLGRMQAHFRRLDAKDVQYHIPMVHGLGKDRVSETGREILTLTSLLQNAEIRYTVDGSEPTIASTLYTGPVTIRIPGNGITVMARAFTPNKRGSVTQKVRIRSSVPIAGKQIARPSGGLAYGYFKGGFPSEDQLSPQNLVKKGAVDKIKIPFGIPDGRSALVYEGYFYAPKAGKYQFHLAADNISVLEVSKERLHMNETWGQAKGDMEVILGVGYHDFRLLIINWSGPPNLNLTFTNPTGEKGEIPSYLWFNE